MRIESLYKLRCWLRVPCLSYKLHRSHLCGIFYTVLEDGSVRYVSSSTTSSSPSHRCIFSRIPTGLNLQCRVHAKRTPWSEILKKISNRHVDDINDMGVCPMICLKSTKVCYAEEYRPECRTSTIGKQSPTTNDDFLDKVASS